MKFFSDCSDVCDNCYIHYSGGCMAGRGDDDFIRITEKDAIEIINRWELDDLQLQKLFRKFPNLERRIKLNNIKRRIRNKNV